MKFLNLNKVKKKHTQIFKVFINLYKRKLLLNKIEYNNEKEGFTINACKLTEFLNTITYWIFFINNLLKTCSSKINLKQIDEKKKLLEIRFLKI